MEFIPKSYGGDELLQITLMDGQARALLVNSTAMCERARQLHTLSNVACAALGRLLTVSAMMGSMLKVERGSVTTTVKGDGPLGALVAVAHEDLTVKGYVDKPRVELPLRSDGKLDVGGAVGKGRLTVVRDLGMREPYVGQVELVNGEIAMDFTYYFATSEQQPTLLSLGVLMPDAAHSAELGVLSAGGLLKSPLPDCWKSCSANWNGVRRGIPTYRASWSTQRLTSSVLSSLTGLSRALSSAASPNIAATAIVNA